MIPSIYMASKEAEEDLVRAKNVFIMDFKEAENFQIGSSQIRGRQN